MEKTYLFYDIETTGLNKAFDQVLSFAAIRTDSSFNEIERRDIRLRLRPDIIPSAQAMITNRIPIAEFSSGSCEYEATLSIHELINTPGTVSLGYNTLGFDDEFLRFSFHRNLLPPYTHQYLNNCRRMDLYPVTIIYWLFERNALKWPEVDGNPTLKLEHLGQINRLLTGPSHDAMVDAEVTLGLARQLISKRKIWNYLEGCFIKETDQGRAEELPVEFESGAGRHIKALLVGGEFGLQQNFIVPALSIGNSIPYTNQSLWLRLDQLSLSETTPEIIAEKTWVIRKRYGEPPLILPPFERYWDKIGVEREAIVKENIAWLQSNPQSLQMIIDYHRQYRYPFIPDLDPDAALYQIGFLSRSDEKLSRQFRTLAPDKKIDMINLFSSPEARSLALRVLGRNYPQYLQDEASGSFDKFMQHVNPVKDEDAILDYRGKRRTTPRAVLREIDHLRQKGDLDLNQRVLIEDLERYVKFNFFD